MALTGILADVTQNRVGGLLLQRQPEILVDDDPGQVARFEERVRGAAVQVVLLTGPDPVPGAVRDLAVEAIALQTASEIEYAEWPEQQAPGDVGRGWHLHRLYLELLDQLNGIVSAAGGAVPTDDDIARTTGIPRGRFPKPQPYPDPVLVRQARIITERPC